MDVFCKYCQEPIDSYEFHHMSLDHLNPGYWEEYAKIVADKGPYLAKYRLFTKYGCNALAGYNSSCKPTSEPDVRLEVAYDLLGDDVDGACSLLEDEGY